MPDESTVYYDRELHRHMPAGQKPGTTVPYDPYKPALRFTDPGAIIEFDPRQGHPFVVATPKVYLIGALKNRSIIDLGVKLRELGYEVFDDWISPGPEADEQWQEYERERGRTYKEALDSYHAWHVFGFDYYHLQQADIVVMVLPCGKSGHLEFGWAIGQGKKGYILFEEEPDRYDVMYRFATDVFMSRQELFDALGPHNPTG